MFLEGRTDTIRSCSIASKAYCAAMQDPSTPPAEKGRLLKEAIQSHRVYTGAVRFYICTLWSFPQGTRRCCDVESTSWALIKRLTTSCTLWVNSALELRLLTWLWRGLRFWSTSRVRIPAWSDDCRCMYVSCVIIIVYYTDLCIHSLFVLDFNIQAPRLTFGLKISFTK